MTDDFRFVATTVSSEAPTVEDGMCDATFEGIQGISVTGGKFANDNGERYEWAFQLLDDDGAVMYEEGEPIIVTGLTSRNMNVNSEKARAPRYLKALMTPAEYDDFVEGKGPLASELFGRKCQVEITHNKNEWPQINNVLPKRTARRSRTPASTSADEE